MSNPPIGSGMVNWLPTELFLSADETRALPSECIGEGGLCLMCGAKMGRERAHIARRQIGGRKKDKGGPQAWLCVECHDNIDESADLTLAIGVRGGLWLSAYADEKYGALLLAPYEVGE